MRFFIPGPPGFTHRARLYGFSCWFRSDGDGADLCGTNVVADWCIAHVAPWCHWLCEQLRAVVEGGEYEPAPWPIELRHRI